MATPPPEGQALTISLTFDLTKDLNRQFKRARHLCEGLQAKGIKPETSRVKYQERWPIYLRILDAKHFGASHKEIGAVLFPDKSEGDAKSHASRYIKNAKRLQQKFPV